MVAARVSVGDLDERRIRRVVDDVRHQGLGQAEVEDLDLPGRGHLDVGGLEVAVDDTLLVRCLEPFRDLQEERDRLVDRDRAAGDAIGQRLAVDQLHDQEARALLGLEAVQGGDVGVVERGQHPRLALEPGQPLGVLRHRLRQHLDRNLAVGAGCPWLGTPHPCRPRRGRRRPRIDPGGCPVLPTRCYGSRWADRQVVAALARPRALVRRSHHRLFATGVGHGPKLPIGQPTGMRQKAATRQAETPRGAISVRRRRRRYRHWAGKRKRRGVDSVEPTEPER